jgi:hypothetical protein
MLLRALHTSHRLVLGLASSAADPERMTYPRCLFRRDICPVRAHRARGEAPDADGRRAGV